MEVVKERHRERKEREEKVDNDRGERKGGGGSWGVGGWWGGVEVCSGDRKLIEIETAHRVRQGLRYRERG